MALKLQVTAQAKRDAGRILGYIARDNPEAARNLADALEQGMLRLRTYPLTGPALANRANPEIRQLIIPPCRVLCRVAAKDVYILGVLRCEQGLP